MQRFYRSFRHLRSGRFTSICIGLLATVSIVVASPALAQLEAQASAGEQHLSSASAKAVDVTVALPAGAGAASSNTGRMPQASTSSVKSAAAATVDFAVARSSDASLSDESSSVAGSLVASSSVVSASIANSSVASPSAADGEKSSLISSVPGSSPATSSVSSASVAAANSSLKVRGNTASSSSSQISLSSLPVFSSSFASANISSQSAESSAAALEASSVSALPKAENMDLRKVVDVSSSSSAVPEASSASSAMAIGDTAASKAVMSTQSSAQSSVAVSQVAESNSSSNQSLMSVDEALAMDTSSSSSASSSLSPSRFLLGHEVPPNTATRLTWIPDEVPSGFTEETPVLVINGAKPGKTLCLTAAVHGDELNGIEMIRRVMFGIDAEKLTGAIIGVPVANIMGFRRNTRYLPDRRDWNRYFPGNTRGSSASRMAYSFFTQVIMKCDALVDLHTGSFHRTNLPQLRADLSNEEVAKFAQNFGSIAVLNSRGNSSSLRVAAVKAGIPAVTIEAGEPMAMQNEVVEAGTLALNSLLAKMGMYGKQRSWHRVSPVYYKSAWVRANQSGILFSRATLGKRVSQGEVLGTVTDPITNQRSEIISPYQGRILGMALDQVVMPGFATYHIGIQTPEAILIEESQMKAEQGMEEDFELDEEDGDDADTPDATPDATPPKANGLDQPVTKPQDSLEDE